MKFPISAIRRESSRVSSVTLFPGSEACLIAFARSFWRVLRFLINTGTVISYSEKVIVAFSVRLQLRRTGMTKYEV